MTHGENSLYWSLPSRQCSKDMPPPHPQNVFAKEDIYATPIGVAPSTPHSQYKLSQAVWW